MLCIDGKFPILKTQKSAIFQATGLLEDRATGIDYIGLDGQRHLENYEKDGHF